jgi:hypothetical protein
MSVPKDDGEYPEIPRPPVDWEKWFVIILFLVLGFAVWFYLITHYKWFNTIG